MAQRVVAVGILEDKKRLIRGQSTENIDTFALTAELSEIQRRREELLKQINVKIQETKDGIDAKESY